MNLFKTITGCFFWACCAAPCPLSAAEVLYAPEESKAENGNMPLYQASSESRNFVASPKFVDDADLNFDDIMLEDIEERSEEKAVAATPAPPPEVPDNVPLLQKNEQDILPSQSRDNSLFPVPVQPLEGAPESGVEGKSLTDTINDKKVEAAPEQKEKDEEKSGGTWLSKLKTPLNALGGSSSGQTANNDLEGLLDSAKQNRGRSNASVFDVSGIMLRMSGQQVDDAMKKRGFQKVLQKFDIPNFIRWRNEETCRNQGVVGYERLESCVVDMARKDKHQYVFQTKYSKFSTKEEIVVNFTSNFTNNKVYRVTYKSMAPTIAGSSPKAVYLRNIKIYDFWKKINQKYGAPDNKDNVTWGLGSGKPYLQAGTGVLILEDPMLRELDYTRMSREDQRYMNTDMYSF